ncbi:hypothetical protein N9W83_01715, partial [Planktomarina temperata]|nr:hypothetical protein [Planktomarina temperata]
MSLLYSFHYARRDVPKPSRRQPSPPGERPTRDTNSQQTICLDGKGGRKSHAQIVRKNFGICFLTLKNPAVAWG